MLTAATAAGTLGVDHVQAVNRALGTHFFLDDDDDAGDFFNDDENPSASEEDDEFVERVAAVQKAAADTVREAENADSLAQAIAAVSARTSEATSRMATALAVALRRCELGDARGFAYPRTRRKDDAKLKERRDEARALAEEEAMRRDGELDVERAKAAIAEARRVAAITTRDDALQSARRFERDAEDVKTQLKGHVQSTGDLESKLAKAQADASAGAADVAKLTRALEARDHANADLEARYRKLQRSERSRDDPPTPPPPSRDDDNDPTDWKALADAALHALLPPLAINDNRPHVIIDPDLSRQLRDIKQRLLSHSNVPTSAADLAELRHHRRAAAADLTILRQKVVDALDAHQIKSSS